MDTLFRSLGFTDTEAKVYLALADGGGCAAGLLAKRIGIPRTTVYSALEILAEKGLVFQDLADGAARFIANPPSSLIRLVNAQREEISRKEEVARELASQLGPLFLGKAFDAPRLQVFRGKKQVRSMLYENTPAWRRSLPTGDYTWWGYQDAGFVLEYRDWLDDTWKTMDTSEKIKLVSQRAPHERTLRGKVPGREIRVLDDTLEFSSTIWILGDFIIMISTKKEPHYAFQIRDEAFAQNLRAIFKLLWSHAQ